MIPIDNSNIVTVVIPAYNAAKWIGETLASVAAQTVGPQRLEVIVVDDGSTDDSAAIAERFLATAGFKRWEVVRQPNRGPGAARNVGWRLGQSNWVRFLDADDLIIPQLTEWQLAATVGADAKLAVVYCNWCYYHTVDQHSRFGERISPFVEDDAVANLLTPGNAIATGSQLYSRNWLVSVDGWDEHLKHAEDHKLTLNVALNDGRFIKIPQAEPGFYYRRHGSSLSNMPGSGTPMDVIAFAEYIESECRSKNRLTDEVLQKLLDIYCCASRDLVSTDWRAASAVLKRIQNTNPGYRPSWSKKAALATGWIGLKPTVFLAGASAVLRRIFPRPRLLLR